MFPDAPVAATAVASGQDENKAARVAASSCTVVDDESPCNGEAGDPEQPACLFMDLYEAEQCGITVDDDFEGQGEEGTAEGEEEEEQFHFATLFYNTEPTLVIRARHTGGLKSARCRAVMRNNERRRSCPGYAVGVASSRVLQADDGCPARTGYDQEWSSCLSGGKDSLSMLHLLRHYQKRNRERNGIRFDLGAITVDPGSTAYNPRPLIDYYPRLNLDYFYEQQDIIGQARKQKNLRSICAFCSRLKRGRLAAAAVHHGWNVLAMGQHLDDLAES